MAEQPFFRTAANSRRAASLAFGQVASAYDRGRPDYPPHAVVWLTGPAAMRVLELGAGTGKLTQSLTALGHEVFATDPDPAMLAILTEKVPEATTTRASAESIPLPDECIDVIVAAQCFHWFDAGRALPEIARVLGPGGQLSVVWNRRDERIPWVRKLGELMGSHDSDISSTLAIEESELFGLLEHKSFPHWQQITRETIVDLVVSRSYVAMQPESDRQALVDEVLALYDSYGRGIDGLRMPYTTECYRAVVLEPPPAPEPAIDDTQAQAAWLNGIGPAQRADGEVLIDLQ